MCAALILKSVPLARLRFWGQEDSRDGPRAQVQGRIEDFARAKIGALSENDDGNGRLVMKRRNFLKGAGVVTILVAGGQIWRVYGQAAPEVGEGPAFEQWRDWEKETREGPLALVHAAILSSNAFNTQPWLFKVNSSRIEAYADTKRNLGAFDPYLRECSSAWAARSKIFVLRRHRMSLLPRSRCCRRNWNRFPIGRSPNWRRQWTCL